MSDRPIIFSGPMIRALIDGRKTQTRRLAWDVVVNPGGAINDGSGQMDYVEPHEVRRPSIWQRVCPGDRLWVREAHAIVPASAYRMSEGVERTVNPSDPDDAAVYRCGWERCAPRWRPSIHMTRWASRLTLTVTDVRVQRLQDISEHDAIAEGVDPVVDHGAGNPHLHKIAFEHLWNHLHGPNAWLANPWVVALTFTVARGNIDAMEGRAGG